MLFCIYSKSLSIINDKSSIDTLGIFITLLAWFITKLSYILRAKRPFAKFSFFLLNSFSKKVFTFFLTSSLNL